jgi:hypothetical protein
VGQLLGSGLGLLVIVVGLVLAVLWILMPFVVFRIKDRIDITNRLLEKISDQLAEQGGEK